MGIGERPDRINIKDLVLPDGQPRGSDSGPDNVLGDPSSAKLRSDGAHLPRDYSMIFPHVAKQLFDDLLEQSRWIHREMVDGRVLGVERHEEPLTESVSP